MVLNDLQVDRLEGFLPGGRSLYWRVMVPVYTGKVLFPVWLYVGGRLSEGRMTQQAILTGNHRISRFKS